MDDIPNTLLTGAGATALLDFWSLARARWGRTPFPDYGLVGRWFAHMAGGRFRHASIAKAAPRPGERWIGWFAHYAIGVAFAGVLIAIWPGWLQDPQLAPALLVGAGSVLAPFLLMQPGMGAGLAARLAPDPWMARRRSLLTHTVFGIGLYLAGLVLVMLERL